MAQIIQYKDREKDTSVYPVTVASAVYMDFNDSSIYQTLDDVIRAKPDSIILFDASYDGSVNYEYISTNNGEILPDNLKENVWENIGIKELLHDLEVSVSNKTLDYANKQDKIVSGQHIKTINGVNIVGPGDVSIYEVDKLLGVDSSFDASSENPLQNKVITDKFKTLEEQDSSIETYIKNQDSSIINYIKKQDASIEEYFKNQDSSIVDAITWENISKQ